MEKKIGSIAYLDGIRGLAAFGVFLNHFALIFYYAFWDLQARTSHLGGLEIKYAHSYWSFITNGGFDVSIFFVLSGFVLSRKFFRSGDPEDAVSGLHRRFLRLYIPIAFTLILSYILLICHLYQNAAVSKITLSQWFPRLWQIRYPEKQFLSSLFYGVMFNGDASFNTVLWTISTEFYGSLFVFAFLLFTNYTPKFRLLMMFFMMYYFYVTGSTSYMAFVLGMTLCYTEKWLERKKIPVYYIISIALLSAALLLGSNLPILASGGSLLYTFKTSVWNYMPWLFTIGAYLLILSFMMFPILQKLISIRPIRFMGYISFSLYLLHPLVLGSFSSWLFLKNYRGPSSYNSTVLTVFISTIAVLIPLSWLVTKYVDQLGIRTAKRVYGLFRKVSPPAGVVESHKYAAEAEQDIQLSAEPAHEKS
ncbi:acyltransferase family protein [Chitinophagaceae bacterium MMS25-I14]